MSNIEQLVDQHIREYESRQKHVDELIERAHRHANEDEELADIKQQRDKLAGELDELKRRPIARWEEKEIEQAGPLALLYILAQQLERLIEKFEK